MLAGCKKTLSDTKLAIGPAVDDGFYYDIRSPFQDLEALEKEMKKI